MGTSLAGAAWALEDALRVAGPGKVGAVARAQEAWDPAILPTPEPEWGYGRGVRRKEMHTKLRDARKILHLVPIVQPP